MSVASAKPRPRATNAWPLFGGASHDPSARAGHAGSSMRLEVRVGSGGCAGVIRRWAQCGQMVWMLLNAHSASAHLFTAVGLLLMSNSSLRPGRPLVLPRRARSLRDRDPGTLSCCPALYGDSRSDGNFSIASSKSDL